MRFVGCVLILACAVGTLGAQEKSEEAPANEKARKTYDEALECVRKHMPELALDNFKKADKQDGGHCLPCQRKMIKYGMEFGDWKTAEIAASEMVSEAQSPKDVALAHYQFGIVLLNHGITKHKDEAFTRSHEEFSRALEAAPNFPNALFADGRVLSYLKQDDSAKQRFEQFVKVRTEDSPDRQRALRYISQPELARARLAPPFAITTLDGERLSMDELQGKAVLLDFWATWCGPCREAMPHMREIAKKFQGQPLLVLSVSLDEDEQQWKDFIAKNEMTWPQYRDGGFQGPIAKLFGVEAIPHTFTIDADGVLQDEHIGDAAIEGKLKKLVGRAKELQASEKHVQ